ncbi:hypothetical protein C9J40_19725 [Photobacterium sp. GB-72]|nr:hypothetical protein C9J40_19725 [Photobacterium sp. GB-72]
MPDMNSVERLSFDDYLEGIDKVVLPSFPSKQLTEIVRLVNDGRSDEISIFEWLDVIEDTKQWDVLDEEQNIEACIAAWQTIVTHQTLGDIALFKVGLALDGKPTSIVNNLKETMAIARTAKGLDPLNIMRIDWLLALEKKDYFQLAQYCYERQQTVISFIKYLRLPLSNSYLSAVNNGVLSCLKDGNLSDVDDIWLHKNYLSLKTTHQKINFCELFIMKFDQFRYGKLCEEMIISNCLPVQEQNFWNRLKTPVKHVLKKKFKLSNYFDLRAISSALYSEQAAEVLGFTDQQTRQIRSRSMFWSNYSSRFERVRVLLPKASFHFVAEMNNGLPPFVDDINESDLLDSEVYIFELGNIIAVEFLRGALSETRFFKNTDWNAQRLFDSRALMISEIRSMSQQEVHDHLPAWQYFCEKLLRTKFKIEPNVNIPYFKGLPPDSNQYQDGIGLLTAPPESMMKERKQALESWVESFWASELKTGKFGELRGLEQKSTLYLSKALMAKQLGNIEDYDFFIKKAANQGNSEAMWQLGRSMLLGNKSDLKTRQYGQDWIGKSASKGHKEAIETANRFRISY